MKLLQDYYNAVQNPDEDKSFGFVGDTKKLYHITQTSSSSLPISSPSPTMTRLTNVLLSIVVVCIVPIAIKAHNDSSRQSNCVSFLMGQLNGHDDVALIRANAKCQLNDTNW